MSEPLLKLTKSYVKVELKTRLPELTTTFPNALRRHASSSISTRDAVVFASPDGSRVAVKWNELYNKSCQFARSLIRLGVKRHEIVANNLRNCPEWLFLTFGAMLAGATPISIAFTYKDGSDVLALMNKLATCSMMVLDPSVNGDNWKIFNNLIDDYDMNGMAKSSKMPFLRYLICHDLPKNSHNTKSLQEMINDGLTVNDVKFPEIDPDDIAALFQTSGSTGVPKVVAHTHKSLLHFAGLNTEDDYDGKEIFFNSRPFSWLGGFPTSAGTGRTLVTQNVFCPEPEDMVSFVIDVIKREKCDFLCALPPFIHEILKKEGSLAENKPFVKAIVTGSQPISKRLSTCVGSLCEWLLVSYGGTEFSCTAFNIIVNSDSFIENACGPVMKGSEVKVVDDNGDTLPVNIRGEIYVRGKGMFKEYLNDPEKTKAAKTDDGWFKTDDIGRLTEDGVLFVEGRKSSMIISGGINVAPEILESLIQSFPGIESAVIVPVPDEIRYQVLCACIIINDAYDVTEEEIRTFCEEKHNDKPRLFTVVPTYYIFMERFPETKSGKLSRIELRELVAQSLQKRDT